MIIISSWCEVLHGGSYCHPGGPHLEQTFHHPCVERLMEEQDWQAATVPWRWQATMGVCWCTSSLLLEVLALSLITCPRSCCHCPVCRAATHQPEAVLPPWAKRPHLIPSSRPTAIYLTVDLWKKTVLTKSPYEEFTEHLIKNPHQSFHSEELVSRCGHHIRKGFIQEKESELSLF